MMQAVSLQQIRALVAVSESGSFTLAGEHLGLSQPGVSALIRRLEVELGQALVIRGRVCQLTRRGTVLAETCAHVLHQLDDAIFECKLDSSLKKGKVRIAVGHLVAACLLPKALIAFANRHPGIEVEVIDCSVDMIKTHLINGSADIGIGAEARVEDSELRIEPLMNDNMALFVCAHHALARYSRVEPQTLETLSLIRTYGNAPVWKCIDIHLESMGISPRFLRTAAQLSTVFGLVQAGLGIALLPSLANSQLPSDLRMVEITDTSMCWPISIVRLAKRPVAPASRALIRVFKEVVS